MKFTEELKAEHRAVMVTLDILEKIAIDFEAGREINLDHLNGIMEFLTIFVDKCHHGKEEKVLFPAMVKAGVPDHGGPVGMMLLEHEEGRKYIRGMKSSLAAIGQGSKDDGQIFVQNAMSYKKLLTQHIYKEDTVLYPMAEQRITETQQADIIEEYDRIEEQEVGHGKHEEFHQMLNLYKSIYLK